MHVQNQKSRNERLTWGRRRSSRSSWCRGRPHACQRWEGSGARRPRSRTATPGPLMAPCRCSGRTRWHSPVGYRTYATQTRKTSGELPTRHQHHQQQPEKHPPITTVTTAKTHIYNTYIHHGDYRCNKIFHSMLKLWSSSSTVGVLIRIKLNFVFQLNQLIHHCY